MNSLLQIGALILLSIGLFLWKREYGLYSVIVAGVLQDVLRKLDSNQSIQYLVLSSLVCLSVLVIHYFQRKSFDFNLIFKQGSNVYQVLSLYLSFIIFSVFWSFYNSSNFFMPALGIFIYLVPVIIVWLIYEISSGYEFVIGILKTYVIVQAVVVITILLQWKGVFGAEFLLFIEVGEGVEIYDETLENYIQGFNGLYRTPEIAAWHMGFAASIALTLLLLTKNKIYQGILLSLVVVFLFAGILSGRRKMIVIFVIFLIQMLWIAFKTKDLNKSITNLFNLSIFTGLAFVIILSISMAENNNFINYINRTISLADVSESRLSLTFYALKESIFEAGLLGYGIGTYSPGARFAQATLPYQWTAEFGLSQIMLEIGLLGAIILAITYITVAKIFLRLRVRVYDHENFNTINGCLFAIIVTHVFGFAIASQVYADFYILILLAIIAGSQLSMLKINKSDSLSKKIILQWLINEK